MNEDQRNIILDNLAHSTRTSDKTKEAIELIVRFSYTKAEAVEKTGASLSSIRKVLWRWSKPRKTKEPRKHKEKQVSTYVPPYRKLNVCSDDKVDSRSKSDCELVKQGLSVSEAARQVGISRQAVSLFLRKCAIIDEPTNTKGT